MFRPFKMKNRIQMHFQSHMLVLDLDFLGMINPDRNLRRGKKILQCYKIDFRKYISFQRDWGQFADFLHVHSCSPQGFATANHPPPSNHVLCILFSHTNELPVLFHYASINLLFDLPPACQFRPQHPSTHTFTVAQHLNLCNLQPALPPVFSTQNCAGLFCLLH